MNDNRKSARAPILIIGPPRSGTTLLATMLNAHPRIFIANESKMFVTLLPRARSYGSALSADVVAAILADLAQNELAHHAPLPSAGQILTDMTESTIPALICALLHQLAVREGKVRWGDKTAVAYRRIEAIRGAFPGARLIGMDRDPLQIASSYEKKIRKWGGLGGLMDWIDFRRALTRQGSSFQIHVVSYEKLTASPAETLRELCAYIGEDFYPGMLEFHQTDRASKLRRSPEFAGVSTGLFTPAGPAPHRGLKGYLMRKLIEIGRRTDVNHLRIAWWERALRSLLFVRATLWELRQPTFRYRVFRNFQNLKRAWSAGHR